MLSNTQMQANIHLFIGPMFSGKTTTLLAEYQKKKIASAYIKRDFPRIFRKDTDKRFCLEGIQTHSGIIQLDAISISCLAEINEHYSDTTDIFIDEGQFFEGLRDKCLSWVRSGKNVYVAALDCYAAHPLHPMWAEVMDLLPYALVTRLTSICFRCKGEATLSMQYETSAIPIEKIGGTDLYYTSCVHCCDMMNKCLEL